MLIVDVADPRRYAEAHLPNAVLVEPRELVDGTPPATGRLPDRNRLEVLFTRLGHRADRTVIVYDDEGGGWAGRMAWTLDVIGHGDWAYLNGGLHAWHAAGLPLESGPGRDPVRAPAGVTLSVDRGPIAEVEDVLAAMDDADQVIWDVRSAEEFAGLKSGSRRAGHVPGAVNIDWLHLKDPNRAMRLVANLEELLASHGITPQKTIITHCQTHHRSGLSYMAARLLGFPRVRAYHGSWSEWGNRDDTPVTGPRP